jgi:hypothetical protein
MVWSVAGWRGPQVGIFAMAPTLFVQKFGCSPVEAGRYIALGFSVAAPPRHPGLQNSWSESTNIVFEHYNQYCRTSCVHGLASRNIDRWLFGNVRAQVTVPAMFFTGIVESALVARGASRLAIRKVAKRSRVTAISGGPLSSVRDALYEGSG